jgi:hypothetical protein
MAWRILAAVIVAAPILSTALVKDHHLLFVPPALTVAGFMAPKVGWPPFLRLCVAGLIAWPFAVFLVFVHSDFRALAVRCAISAFFLFLLAVPGIWRSFGLTARLPKALRIHTYGTLKTKGIPLLATTTKRETPEGVEYTVTWTDFAKLRFADRESLMGILPFASVVLLLFGTLAQGLVTRWGDTMITVGGLLGVGWVAMWLFKLYYQRSRLTPRSLVIEPDGTILLGNPPSADASTESDAPPRTIPNGLARLTSIEYGKTAEWQTLTREDVYAIDAWYDVHLVFGTEGRVSVSRNFGSRDHAHQVAGELNNLKARLTSERPRRPQAEKIID